MERQTSFRAPRKQLSFRAVTTTTTATTTVELVSNPSVEKPPPPPCTNRLMRKQLSFQGVPIEKQPSTRPLMEKQLTFVGRAMEKQKSYRGLMEKQKSFRLLMERQLSFISGGERNKKKKVESPGKKGDLPLHVAARGGNLRKIKEIMLSYDHDGSRELLTKHNLDGETPLYSAAENGHLVVVQELLKHIDLEIASSMARNGYDAFHVAAKHGHLEVLKELLGTFPDLVMTTDLSCTTALHTAAAQGNTDVVNLLLETDSNLAKIAKNNGKTALHSAARMGHLDIVKSLISKDPSTAFRIDKKGQTALHMAVKGQSEDIVLELLKPDVTILSVEDNKGNTALHVATKKGRSKIVCCLISTEGINVNTINKAGECPLDIAEKSGTTRLVSILKQAGALTSKELGRPPNAAKQFKQTVSDIKHEVHTQLQQSHQTGVRVQKIAKRLKKLHINGLNNAINSATVVAVLIATVAFAAIFTVPGQYVEEKTEGFSLGQAHIADKAPFFVFFVSDSLALFISLAVVVVQTSVVVIEQKAKKQLVFVINKLMWLACVFISIAFISLTYVVVGKHSRWLALWTTLIGGVIMLTTIGSMCYFVILHRLEESKLRSMRRAESQSHSVSLSMAAESEILSNEYKRMYAL